MDKIHVEPLSLLIYIDRHNVDVVAFYIGVLIDYVGLLSESEFVEILAGNVGEVGIRQYIIWMWIEGDMENRLLCASCLRHVVFEILHHFRNADFSVRWHINLVSREYATLLLVDFLSVV